jgi:hypothetical protein
MTTTYSIVQLDRLTSTGYVKTVHYNVTKTDGDFSASTYGTISYTPDGSESGTMIPFASLTEAQVIAWVKDKLGEATVEAALAAQIEAQKNPVKASGLPWGQA